MIAALVMGLMKAMAEADINWFQSCQIAGMRSLGLSLGWILGILGLFLGMYQFLLHCSVCLHVTVHGSFKILCVVPVVMSPL